jgi:tRNA G18 (ribose-2'-O)-methylase SpoU
MLINILLYNLRSVYNTASIFRTADGAGCVEKIYLTGTTPTPKDKIGEWRSDFIKVSLGAEKNILWEYIKTLPQTKKLILSLKKQGYKILAVEQNKNSIPYYKLKLKNKDKILLIFGSETKGLPPSILKTAHHILEIPMKGKLLKNAAHPKKTKLGKESLNVSVSAGIVLFRILYD